MRWRVRQPASRPRHAVVVDLKSAVEPEPPIERKCPDKRERLKTRPSEPFGEERNGAVDADPVVPRAMPRRIAPAQDRRMRRQGNRRCCIRARELRPAGRQRIDRRSASWGVTIRPDPIRAQCVDGDQHDVVKRDRPPGHVAPSAASHRAQRADYQQANHQ